jgi:hypothetical protein
MKAANMNNMANPILVEDVVEILRNRLEEDQVEEQPTSRVEVRVLAQWLSHNDIQARIVYTNEITSNSAVISDRRLLIDNTTVAKWSCFTRGWWGCPLGNEHVGDSSYKWCVEEVIDKYYGTPPSIELVLSDFALYEEPPRRPEPNLPQGETVETIWLGQRRLRRR